MKVIVDRQAPVTEIAFGISLEGDALRVPRILFEMLSLGTHESIENILTRIHITPTLFRLRMRWRREQFRGAIDSLAQLLNGKVAADRLPRYMDS